MRMRARTLAVVIIACGLVAVLAVAVKGPVRDPGVASTDPRDVPGNSTTGGAGADDHPGDPASWRSIKAVHTDGTPGAECTGGGDDRAAIQKHLDEVSAAGGGTVYHPKSTCVVGDTLVIPGNVTYRGDGRDASALKAASGFRGGKPLVRLTGRAKIADAWFSADGKPNTTIVLIGGRSNGVELSHIFVGGYSRYGVKIAAGAKNFLYEGDENYGGKPTNANTYAGIRCDRAQGTIRMVTTNGARNNSSGWGLESTGCDLVVHGIHFERWAGGIWVDAATTGEVVTALGGPADNPTPTIADASSGAHMEWVDLVPFDSSTEATLRLPSKTLTGRVVYRRS